MSYDRQELARLLTEKRRREALSVRAAALGAGLSSATFSRIENGELASGQNFYKLLLWLNISPSALTPNPPDSNRMEPLLPGVTVPAPASKAGNEQVRAHFRAARNLDPRTTAALAEALRRIASLIESSEDAEDRTR